VEEYVQRLKGLRWQAMKVRCEEEQECLPGQDPDDLRRFDMKHVVEMAPEGGLSRLGQACEAAGLQHMFLTALKIQR
jgi:hypothetical protein